jgi:hypothetical protein
MHANYNIGQKEVYKRSEVPQSLRKDSRMLLPLMHANTTRRPPRPISRS